MDTAILALRVLLSLAVVLGLLWVVQRRLVRGARAMGRNPITVVGRQGIGQKASLVIVEADGRRFLLGVTEQSVNVLHTSEAPTIEADSFGRSLAEAATANPEDGSAQPAPDQPPFDHRFPVQLPPVQPAGGRGRRAARSADGWEADNSVLAGSVLSPATWRQAAAALRRGRSR